jgi:hypothetical protein
MKYTPFHPPFGKGHSMKRYCMLTLFLTACYKTEYSAELREPGRVEQVTFTPGGTSTGTSYNFNKGTTKYHTVETPDRFAVVLSCMHGKFVLNPEGATARAMFLKLKQGDSITIHYREVYHVKDGQRELYKLDFLDATSRNANSERF